MVYNEKAILYIVSSASTLFFVEEFYHFFGVYNALFHTVSKTSGNNSPFNVKFIFAINKNIIFFIIGITIFFSIIVLVEKELVTL